MTDGAGAPYPARMRFALLAALTLALAACSSDPAPVTDAGVDTGPAADLGADAETPGDLGASDTGSTIDDTGAMVDAGADAATVLPIYGACAAGMDCMPPTTCQQVALRGDGGAFGTICTTACPGGDARMCPGYAAGQVECVNAAEDPSAFRCVRICAADPDCAPLGLRCRQTTLAGGVGASVCLP